MNLKRIIAELKKRNVVKEALAYLVVAWMILQVASTILPIFDSPAYTMRIMVIILLIGFPLWVVFSWIYTITPKGIHKTAKNETTLPVKTKILIGERLNKIIIISLVIAVILLLYNQYKMFVKVVCRLGWPKSSGSQWRMLSSTPWARIYRSPKKVGGAP